MRNSCNDLGELGQCSGFYSSERFMIPLSTLNQKIKRLGIDVRRRGRADESFIASVGK